MTIEERLVPPNLRDALREANVELSILLEDKVAGVWRAYGIFPAGTDDHRLSSPVGNGKTPVAAVEALLGLTTAYRPSWGLMTRLWACGDALASLALALRPKRAHVWFKCEQPCEKQHCVYCDGGLAYCVVCKAGECELEPTCPGAPE